MSSAGVYRIHKSDLPAVAVAIKPGGVSPARAALERVGPVGNDPRVGGFPAWHQDTTGMSPEFRAPLNASGIESALIAPAGVTDQQMLQAGSRAPVTDELAVTEALPGAAPGALNDALTFDEDTGAHGLAAPRLGTALANADGSITYTANIASVSLAINPVNGLTGTTSVPNQAINR
jgi:hypothetical protein